MATCPECDAEIEVDEFDVDKGDLISCPDCGSNLEVTGTSPVELEVSDEERKKAKEKGGEFWVKDAQGTSHPFQLDAKQIADVLDGSMVMVDAKDASGSAAPLRVSLQLKPTEPEKAAKSSGW